MPPSPSAAPADALRCPGCGAAASPDAARCPYCTGTLAVIACPSCFAANFRGSRFCARCGEATAREPGAATLGACPRCAGSLAAARVGDVALHDCAACGGVWLDAGVFARLCADHEQRGALARHVSAAAPPAAADVDVDRVRYLACPCCRRLMNRVNVARISGVIVDLCRTHGAWLDAGELARLVAFLDAGGMDRARAREREQLDAERRRIELQRATAQRERDGTYRAPGPRADDADDLLGLLLAALRAEPR